VVASQAASIPEVAGDAALLVDPLDEDALARALRAAVEREPLRRRLRKLGLERVRRYSWDETARLTAEALEEAAEGPAG
jgi:glycosyltransferase involved in cell wall biosynthesis